MSFVTIYCNTNIKQKEGRSEKKQQSGTLTKRGFKNIRKSVGQL